MAHNSPNTPDTVACAANISEEALSAWRDSLLPDAEMARIRQHLPTCPACQRRLADFETVAAVLRRQRDIEPDERILAGVRRRAAGEPPRWRVQRTPLNRQTWGRLGAVAAVAAVLLLFVYVFGGIGGRSSIPASKTPTVTQAVSPTPTFSATTPAHPIDAKTAWGANAATAVSTKLDATHVLQVGGITPDGKKLLGFRVPLTATGQLDLSGQADAGFMDIATRRFTSIGISQGTLGYTKCCVSDGRYLLVEQDTSPQTSCGSCHTDYWSYDMTTGQKYLIAHGTDFQQVNAAYLSNGYVLLWTGDGARLADLATHALTPVTQIPGSGQVAAFTWPDVVYFVPNAQGTATQMHVYDLTTGHDTTLSQVSGNAIFALIVGNTLFYINAPVNGNGPSTLFELDAFLAAGSTPRAIATYNNLAPTSANARLILFNGTDDGADDLVWDRTEQQFVRLGYQSDTTEMAGDYLVTYPTAPAVEGGAPTSVSIYNTTALPTQTGG